MFDSFLNALLSRFWSAIGLLGHASPIVGGYLSLGACSRLFLDPLPTFFLKDCFDVLLPSIIKLVKCLLDEGR